VSTSTSSSLWSRASRASVSVVLLGVVFSYVDVGEAAGALGRAPLWVFAVPSICLLINSWIQAWRVRWLLGAFSVNAPVGMIFRVFLMGNFWGLALPMGGAEATRLLLLHRRLQNLDACAASLFMARLLETLPWGALLVWGLASGWLDSLPFLAAAAWIGLVLFSGAWVLSIGFSYARPSARERLPSWLARPVTRAVEALAQFRGHRRLLIVCALLGVPFTLVNAGVVWAVFIAFSVPLGYAAVLGIVPAADVWISLPVSMGGVGVRESVFVLALTPFGVTKTVALAVIFTRWTGELGRALMGGVFLAIGTTGPVPDEA